jgi:hypothetical protein
MPKGRPDGAGSEPPAQPGVMQGVLGRCQPNPAVPVVDVAGDTEARRCGPHRTRGVARRLQEPRGNSPQTPTTRPTCRTVGFTTAELLTPRSARQQCLPRLQTAPRSSAARDVHRRWRRRSGCGRCRTGCGSFVPDPQGCRRDMRGTACPGRNVGKADAARRRDSRLPRAWVAGLPGPPPCPLLYVRGLDARNARSKRCPERWAVSLPVYRR